LPILRLGILAHLGVRSLAALVVHVELNRQVGRDLCRKGIVREFVGFVLVENTIVRVIWVVVEINIDHWAG
jgi:hypothetical protein